MRSCLEILLLVGSAVGAPTILELDRRDDPSLVPVDLTDGPSVSWKCGSTTFDSKSIYQAAQYGTLLENAGMTRGKESYQHQFNNYEGVALSSKCVAEDVNMKEYPIIAGTTYYNGGKNNRNTGDHRIVYLHNTADYSGVESNPISTFCGLITHEGASGGQFLACTQA